MSIKFPSSPVLDAAQLKELTHWCDQGTSAERSACSRILAFITQNKEIISSFTEDAVTKSTLSLSSLSLTSLPTTIWLHNNFKDLTELDLTNNRLNDLPDSLANLSFLKTIKCALNNLNPLPPKLQQRVKEKTITIIS